MRAPIAAQQYHVAHFDRTAEAAAFVAALTRFLDSPRGRARTTTADGLEVWVDSASTGAGVEIYMSDDALAAATTGFSAPPLAGMRRGDALAADCALVIGSGTVALDSADKAEAHLHEHRARKARKAP